MELSKIFYRTLGGVNIIQFRSISASFESIYIFLFQSLDVRPSEKLYAGQRFKPDLL